MTAAFAIVLIIHRVIHLLGFAKSFGLADLPQLTQPISRIFGAIWLTAAVLFAAAAAALFVWPRGWWAVAALAVAVSTVAILASWSDAKFGLVGNLLAVVGVIFGFLATGPTSLRAAYERDVDRGLANVALDGSIDDASLERLPAPVRRYLQTAGVVGQPRVRNFRARMHGRIRDGRQGRWMPLKAEQYNFIDNPARLFYMDASMASIPVQGYHHYVGSRASMTVKAAALVPVAQASSEEMSLAETVTMFNDMCVLAPATLIDPALVWETIDARTVRVQFVNAGHTIRAELSFNEAGELIDFCSDDRSQAAADGKSVKKMRWSTPLRDYRAFGGVRLASRGEARWHEPDGDYPYVELTFDSIEYNVVPR